MELNQENLEAMMELSEYYSKLKEALLSFDIEKIRDFSENFADAFGMSVPEDDDTLYASAMMALLELNIANEEQKNRAKTWLKENWNHRLN